MGYFNRSFCLPTGLFWSRAPYFQFQLFGICPKWRPLSKRLLLGKLQVRGHVILASKGSDYDRIWEIRVIKFGQRSVYASGRGGFANRRRPNIELWMLVSEVGIGLWRPIPIPLIMYLGSKIGIWENSHWFFDHSFCGDGSEFADEETVSRIRMYIFYSFGFSNHYLRDKTSIACL